MPRRSIGGTGESVICSRAASRRFSSTRKTTFWKSCDTSCSIPCARGWCEHPRNVGGPAIRRPWATLRLPTGCPLIVSSSVSAATRRWGALDSATSWPRVSVLGFHGRKWSGRCIWEARNGVGRRASRPQLRGVSPRSVCKRMGFEASRGETPLDLRARRPPSVRRHNFL